MSLLPPENPCDEDASLEWRSINYGLEKSLESVKFLDEQTKLFSDSCDLVPCVIIPLAGCTDVARTVCEISTFPLKALFPALIFAAELALSISERIYDEKCTPSPSQVESDKMKGRQNAIYENVITNHGNIITTFQATQQLKIMLGEVSDGVKEANEALLEENNRRLQLEDCVNTTSADGFKRGCNQTSCEDITKLCDGSPNYLYTFLG